MCQKVDECEAISQHQVTSVDTKWIDTKKASEGEPMQIRSQIVASEFKSEDRPDLCTGTPPLDALKATISIAANHKQAHHTHRRVTRTFMQNLRDTCLCGDQWRTEKSDRRRAGVVGSSSTQKIQDAGCKMFVPQSRSSRYNIHCEREKSKDVKHNRALPS